MDYLSLFSWSFLAVALGIACIVDLLKKISKLNPDKKKWFDLLTDGRIFPAVLGFLFGWIPGAPLPEIVKPGIGAALYYMSAGIFSTWVYAIFEKVFRTLRDHLPEKIKGWLDNFFSTAKKDGAGKEGK